MDKDAAKYKNISFWACIVSCVFMIAVGVILILPQIDRIIKIVVGVIMLVIYIGVIIFLIVVTKKFANRPIEDLADSSPKAEEQLSSQTEAREPSLDNTQNS